MVDAAPVCERRFAGVVWSAKEQCQPFVAAKLPPIVIVTAHVPVVPLRNEPADAPPKVVELEQPEAVNLVPMDWKADDSNMLSPTALLCATMVPLAGEARNDRPLKIKSVVAPTVMLPLLVIAPEEIARLVFIVVLPITNNRPLPPLARMST